MELGVNFFCSDNDLLKTMVSDIDKQDLLEKLMPTDEVMQELKNRTLFGSGNPVYDQFSSIEEKHHGGCMYSSEDGWEDY